MLIWGPSGITFSVNHLARHIFLSAEYLAGTKTLSLSLMFQPKFCYILLVGPFKKKKEAAENSSPHGQIRMEPTMGNRCKRLLGPQSFAWHADQETGTRYWVNYAFLISRRLILHMWVALTPQFINGLVVFSCVYKPRHFFLIGFRWSSASLARFRQ